MNKKENNCQFDDGTNYPNNKTCKKPARFRTTVFRKNFNLCEEHAKLYRSEFDQLKEI